MKSVIRFIAIPLIVGMASLPLMLHASDDDDDEDEREFTVQLHSLNGSGVTGKAVLKIKNGNTFKIELEADGLEANMPHAQHIHGLSAPVRIATCPDSSADVDADGLVSVGEGLPFYGPIVLPLTPFDLVGSDGELRYEARFTINPGAVQPLQKRTIVLHGMMVNGRYIGSLPVACGQVVEED